MSKAQMWDGSQSQMHGISTYCETNCHHPFAQNREGHCHRLFFCCTTMHTVILLSIKWPPFQCLTGTFSTTQPTVQTWWLHLAGLIKEVVRGWRFTDHDTRHYWSHTELKTLYSDAFKMVVDCWAKCSEKQEDHAETVITTRWIKNMWERKYGNFLNIPQNFDAFS
jgi:hypothetical protein